MEKRKVILVTDGDTVAQKAVETAAANIGGRCISMSAGNPTLLTGEEISGLIHQAEHDPVIVMVDDRGQRGKGRGEEAMEVLLRDEGLDIMGVVAVSSNGKDCNGINVTCSVTKDGKVVEGGAVDKYGNDIGRNVICGDTLSVLKGKKDIVIVGLGDPGKMDFNDEAQNGSPITTTALKEVIRRNTGH